MKRLPTLAAASLALILSAGCSHIPFFGKKTPSPTKVKTDSHIATQSEIEFEGRWVTHRAGELVSQGQTQDQARAQAETEFKEKYSATHPAQ